MDQTEFRTMKETGELVTDAALQEEVVEEEKEVEEEPKTNEEIEQELEVEVIEEDELPEAQQTAFVKRMEREKEKLRKEMEVELEAKYGKHKEVLESLGGDPDVILQRLRENQLANQANRLAEQNGWDEEQTQWYIEQQKQQNELKELRVQMQINKLKDNPDYAGIGSMEKDILAKIDKSNGALSVEEAYWAMGGPKKAEQIRLESQMREAEKRKKVSRTVITDSQGSTTGEKPLPPEIAQQAARMNISTAEARRLMNNEPAMNIDEWREKRKAK